MLDAIASDDIALVYPALEGETVSAPDKFSKYIILDGTWQEARKIVNRSPYLQDLPKVMLNSSAPSRYTLRRNQKEQGLCTAECVIELLKINQEYELADELDLAFTQFNGRGYCAEN